MGGGEIAHLAMSKHKKNIILVMRLLLGFIFVYASISKIIDPQTFARSIDNYHMMPFGLENTMAVLMPWVELLVGVALIIGLYVDGAALLAGGMALMFIVAITQAILRGYNIECGCGLNPHEMVGVKKLLEDCIYLVWACLICTRKDKRFEIGRNSV